MKQKNTALLYTHIAVFFFGLSGVIAKDISQSALIVVAGRVFFASVILLIIALIRRTSLKIASKKDLIPILLMGIILAAHWGLFFWSVKISSVAIGLLTVSTFPIFAAILEPIFFHEKLHFRSVIASIIALIGIGLVVPEFSLSSEGFTGVLAGTGAGFLFAVLSLINRNYINKYPGITLAFYQDLIALVVLLPFVVILQPSISMPDILKLAFLGVFCTGLAHTLFIISLKNLKATTAGIVTMLEPVYGVLLAIPIFGEIPNLKTILGGIVILSVAIYITKFSEKYPITNNQ